MRSLDLTLGSFAVIAACGGTTAGVDGGSDASNDGSATDSPADVISVDAAECTPPNMKCATPCPSGTFCLRVSGPVENDLGAPPHPGRVQRHRVVRVHEGLLLQRHHRHVRRRADRPHVQQRRDLAPRVQDRHHLRLGRRALVSGERDGVVVAPPAAARTWSSTATPRSSSRRSRSSSARSIALENDLSALKK